MKIYTRKGDGGGTKLFGGKSVSKASLRIDAYGEADELSTVLGVAAARLSDTSIRDLIKKLQRDLHVVCSDLANPDKKENDHRVSAQHVEAVEKQCDEFEAKLTPLKKFILPGGTPAGAYLHFARAVTRRAERAAVRLAEEEPVNTEVIRYLNRLSDLLFLLARWTNHQAKEPEIHPE